MLSKTCFDKPDFYELFDLDKDPYELNNIFASASAALKQQLHERLRRWYPCQGTACP